MQVMMIEKKYIDYLKWRCKFSRWHSNYLKSNWYIDTWIAGVTYDQLQYFIKEMEHLIERGIYKP